MVTDCFTKNLQGSLFRKLKDVIMVATHPILLSTKEPPPTKERVERNTLLKDTSKNSYNAYVAGGDVTTNSVPNPTLML